jgi:hypothetical protein
MGLVYLLMVGLSLARLAWSTVIVFCRFSGFNLSLCRLLGGILLLRQRIVSMIVTGYKLGKAHNGLN